LRTGVLLVSWRYARKRQGPPRDAARKRGPLTLGKVAVINGYGLPADKRLI